MTADGDDLLESAQSHFGPSLQTVSTFHSEGYEKLYFRDDIDELYTEDELSEIFRNLVWEGLSKLYIQDLFYAGDMVCSMWVLQGSVMLLFADEDHTGAFVTVDVDTDADVLDFVRIVERSQSDLD